MLWVGKKTLGACSGHGIRATFAKMRWSSHFILLFILIATSLPATPKAFNKHTSETCEDLTFTGSEPVMSLPCTAGHPWRDSRQPPFACREYTYDACDSDGDSYENDNMTANDACCVLHGGNQTANATCYDAQFTGGGICNYGNCTPGTDWYSSDETGDTNRTCNTFSDKMCTEPAGGSMYVNDNMTANDACCVCGGGISSAGGPTDAPTGAPPIDPPTDAPGDEDDVYKFTNETCEDLTFTGSGTCNKPPCTAGHAWRDSREPPFACIQYSYEDCVLLGNSYENDNMTANDACCVCNGGSQTANATCYDAQFTGGGTCNYGNCTSGD